ncbi:hypothetical protein [Moraxella oblonga]|uniref:hypothetical protein n=1 Tax=Moraxella oblonga TaxID=200413 RepID=UPI0008333EC2|nr:hypothetical protein [Moraxella oblonga]
MNTFPDKSAIQYSEGTLKTIKRRASRHHTVTDVVLVPFDSKVGTTYYCDYTAQHTAVSSSCLPEEKIAPYRNQSVRIGWYQKSDVLWFHNPHPQLVSLEVDGEVIRSYEYSLKIAKDRIGIGDIIVYGFITIGWGIVYVCVSIIGRRSLKEYRKQSKINEV